MTTTSIELLSRLGPAFIVGFFGSAAYITALFFKFIGDSEERRRIVIGPFLRSDMKKAGIMKCIWYCIIGGFVATVFQFDVPNFVAVQSLILGATWPAIVSQFLSGRMTSPSQKEVDEFVNSQPASPLNTDEISKRLEEIHSKLTTTRRG